MTLLSALLLPEERLTQILSTSTKTEHNSVNCQQREAALCAMSEERASFTRTLTLKLQQEMRLRPCPPLTWSLLELSTVCDSDLLGGSPRPRTERLHFLDHVHSLLHAAKDNMPIIQPKRRKRRFIIMMHPTGSDSWCFVGWWHYFCNSSAILGHYSNLNIFFLLSCQNFKRIQLLQPRILFPAGWKKTSETAL